MGRAHPHSPQNQHTINSSSQFLHQCQRINAIATATTKEQVSTHLTPQHLISNKRKIQNSPALAALTCPAVITYLPCPAPDDDPAVPAAGKAITTPRTSGATPMYTGLLSYSMVFSTDSTCAAAVAGLLITVAAAKVCEAVSSETLWCESQKRKSSQVKSSPDSVFVRLQTRQQGRP